MYAKKFLTNGRLWCLISLSNRQTYDAEITLLAHPQRVPGAESGAKSGAANGPPRAEGTSAALVSSDDLPPLPGRRCAGTVMRRLQKQQARWHKQEKSCPCFPNRGGRDFFISHQEGNAYDESGKTMAWLNDRYPLFRSCTKMQNSQCRMQNKGICSANNSNSRQSRHRNSAFSILHFAFH